MKKSIKTSKKKKTELKAQAGHDMSKFYHGVATGYLLGMFLMISCAGIQSHFYTVEMPVECYEKGTLLGRLGPKGWPDLPLSECLPSQSDKAKCFIQFDEDYFNKERALQKCQKDLIECQRGAPPS